MGLGFQREIGARDRGTKANHFTKLHKQSSGNQHTTPTQHTATMSALPPIPDKLDGPKLRALSDTLKYGGPRPMSWDEYGNKRELRSDQAKCHRIENATLAKAYNSTDNEAVKRGILKFNYSRDNMFAGAHNDDHSEMERALHRGNASATQLQQKGEMLKTAMNKLNKHPEDYSADTVQHILKTLREESSDYNEVVADVDLRGCCAQAKVEVRKARQERDDYYKAQKELSIGSLSGGGGHGGERP